MCGRCLDSAEMWDGMWSVAVINVGIFDLQDVGYTFSIIDGSMTLQWALIHPEGITDYSSNYVPF